mgnify:CR=1 FL=1
MDIFEKMNHFFTETGKEVEQKAREFSDAMRLNTKIRDEKAAIKECMEKIGRLYYEEQKGNGSGVYQEAFERIHKAKEAIRQAQKEMDEQKKRTTCQNCGASMQKEDLFCSKCGTKRETKDSDDEEIKEAKEKVQEQEKDDISTEKMGESETEDAEEDTQE